MNLKQYLVCENEKSFSLNIFTYNKISNFKICKQPFDRYTCIKELHKMILKFIFSDIFCLKKRAYNTNTLRLLHYC